eukprot:SAG22_NODE_2759_length_2238_cov_1.535297_2_plen_126_part_00
MCLLLILVCLPACLSACLSKSSCVVCRLSDGWLGWLVVQIVDFGLAKAARAREKMQDICGTVYYYAPEIVDEDAYGPLVDEWALGVSMFILLTGSYPFYDDDEDELCLKIVGCAAAAAAAAQHSP